MTDLLGEPKREDLIRVLGDAERPLSIADVNSALRDLGLGYTSQSTLARRLKDIEREGMCFQTGREGRVLSPAGSAEYRRLREDRARTDLLGSIHAISSSEGLEQLMRIRRAVEPEAAREFAATATDDDIEQLREMVAHYREVVAPGGLHPRSVALDFHRYIAQKSTNPFVRLVLNEALHERTGRIEAAMDVVLQQHRTHESSIHFHGDVIDAIVRRDPRAAEDSMRAHLDTLIAEIEAIKEGRELVLLDSILEWSLVQTEDR